MYLFNDNPVHEVAFSKGFKAWDKYLVGGCKTKPGNPYKKCSDAWYSWNKGWNLNFNGI